MLKMNAYRTIALIALVTFVASGLTACNKVNSEEPNAVVKPVKLTTFQEFKNLQVHSFIGKLDATERAVLSFNVAGEIASKMVSMGKQVKKGEILAYLDPTDYQLAVNASQAEFDLAQTQYDRATKLIKDALISTDQFDQSETNFKVAKAKLAQAKTDLAYTQIVAPFNGTVSITHAESHQVVGANQAIMKLLNNAVMDVIFTLPVSYVAKYGVDQISQSKMWVTVDSNPDIRIEARFKEISTQPNQDTNSYTARTTIKRPDDLVFLSGMTGQVHLSNDNNTAIFTLPDTAWISRNSDKGWLWKFDPTEQRLQKVEVLFDKYGNVKSGLKDGDRVVETGINGLSEGQRVKAWIEEDGI